MHGLLWKKWRFFWKDVNSVNGKRRGLLCLKSFKSMGKAGMEKGTDAVINTALAPFLCFNC